MPEDSAAGVNLPAGVPTRQRPPEGEMPLERPPEEETTGERPPEGGQKPPDKRTIIVTVNGKAYSRTIETRTTLVDFLRYDLHLTGTHVGCEHGVCGACTVLVDGLSARACLMLAVQCDGAEVSTVEGLAAEGMLHPLQEAMRDCHGLQCGFCTPGVLMTLTEFLRDHTDPTEAQVREALTGNLCRCTGYQGMVDAALRAAKRMREAL